MKYWPGLIMLAFGAWMFASAVMKRSRVLAAWRQAVAEGKTPDTKINPKLVTIAAVTRPLVIGGLLVAGLEVVAVFAATDIGRNFSWVDLGGFLALLVGYGVWFMINTRYREVVITS